MNLLRAPSLVSLNRSRSRLRPLSLSRAPRRFRDRLAHDRTRRPQDPLSDERRAPNGRSREGPDLPATYAAQTRPRSARAFGAPITAASAASKGAAADSAMTTLDEAAATLRVIVPGWLALRVFYARAFPTRRSDLELVLFGLVFSLPIYWLASWLTTSFRSADETATLLVALVVGAVGGGLAAEGWWWAIRRWPRLWVRFVPTAWDAYLGHPRGGWLQVRTVDGLIYHGWVEHASSSVEAETPDLYLREPAYVGKDGEPEPIPGVEGVVIPRTSVVSVIRFAPTKEPESPTRS